MPKNRKRNNRKGAKSISIRTKFKIGGRKSNRGAKQMTSTDLLLTKVRPRDQNKARQVLQQRGYNV